MDERWGHSEELLVVIAQMLDQLIRLTAKLHAERPPHFGPPFDYPRPYQRERRQTDRPATPAEILAFFRSGR